MSESSFPSWVLESDLWAFGPSDTRVIPCHDHVLTSVGNTFADYEAAPVPPTGLPANEIHPADPKNVKEVVSGPGGHTQDVTVTQAADYMDGEMDPTEEEYATLRK